MKTLFTLLLTFSLGIACNATQAQVCSAASTSLNFGTYNPQSSSNLDNTATVTVTCQATLSLLMIYTVKLSAGSSGSYSQRKMLSGANTLNYQVYGESTHTTIWGDGTSSTGYISDGYLLQVLTPVVKSYTAYGRAPGSQNVKAGSYTDTLTILVTY
ncbi:spore coat protein U domain-containing protein [Herbaspirillum sp. LeCh32-8]|uniref:Csu type fimbrial protein n=1 Tax=Herbaspirillum sp. LeCh32-8 TaxID=2821356 RepID=UPI001AE99E7F|nr:spore coat U domain-containing protein [Herbaspirillum sp. LeCh32-8]MBP0600512.1 spore coat protein U domain-containing protein [Herbaspirillum sp. LeCh32-8]